MHDWTGDVTQFVPSTTQGNGLGPEKCGGLGKGWVKHWRVGLHLGTEICNSNTNKFMMKKKGNMLVDKNITRKADCYHTKNVVSFFG